MRFDLSVAWDITSTVTPSYAALGVVNNMASIRRPFITDDGAYLFVPGTTTSVLLVRWDAP